MSILYEFDDYCLALLCCSGEGTAHLLQGSLGLFFGLFQKTHLGKSQLIGTEVKQFAYDTLQHLLSI